MNLKITKDQREYVNRMYIQTNKDCNLEVTCDRRAKYFNIFMYAGVEEVTRIKYINNVWAAQKIVQGLILEFANKETRTDLRWMLE